MFKLKKLLCYFVSTIMIFTSIVPAFADEETSQKATTGEIVTINANPGNTTNVYGYNDVVSYEDILNEAAGSDSSMLFANDYEDGLMNYISTILDKYKSNQETFDSTDYSSSNPAVVYTKKTDIPAETLIMLENIVRQCNGEQAAINAQFAAAKAAMLQMYADAEAAEEARRAQIIEDIKQKAKDAVARQKALFEAAKAATLNDLSNMSAALHSLYEAAPTTCNAVLIKKDSSGDEPTYEVAALITNSDFATKDSVPNSLGESPERSVDGTINFGTTSWTSSTSWTKADSKIYSAIKRVGLLEDISKISYTLYVRGENTIPRKVITYKTSGAGTWNPDALGVSHRITTSRTVTVKHTTAGSVHGISTGFSRFDEAMKKFENGSLDLMAEILGILGVNANPDMLAAANTAILGLGSGTTSYKGVNVDAAFANFRAFLDGVAPDTEESKEATLGAFQDFASGASSGPLDSMKGIGAQSYESMIDKLEAMFPDKPEALAKFITKWQEELNNVTTAKDGLGNTVTGNKAKEITAVKQMMGFASLCDDVSVYEIVEASVSNVNSAITLKEGPISFGDTGKMYKWGIVNTKTGKVISEVASTNKPSMQYVFTSPGTYRVVCTQNIQTELSIAYSISFHGYLCAKDSNGNMRVIYEWTKEGHMNTEGGGAMNPNSRTSDRCVAYFSKYFLNACDSEADEYTATPGRMVWTGLVVVTGDETGLSGVDGKQTVKIIE